MKISVSFFLRDGNRTLGKQLSNFELYLIRVLGKAYLNYISYFFCYHRSQVSQFEDLLIVQNTLAMSHRGVSVGGGGGVEGGGEALRQLCPLKVTTLCC